MIITYAVFDFLMPPPEKKLDGLAAVDGQLTPGRHAPPVELVGLKGPFPGVPADGGWAGKKVA